MSKLNLRVLNWPTCDIINSCQWSKCIPNLLTSIIKVGKWKSREGENSQEINLCGSGLQFPLPPGPQKHSPLPLSAQCPRLPNLIMKKQTSIVFIWWWKWPNRKQANDSFMIHCGPTILISYCVISCNTNRLEVKVGSGLTSSFAVQ